MCLQQLFLFHGILSLSHNWKAISCKNCLRGKMAQTFGIFITIVIFIMAFSSNDHHEYFTIMSLQLYFPRSPLLGTIKMIVNQNRFVDHHIFSATRRSDVVSGWIFWRKKRLLSLPALLSLTLTFVLFFSFIRWPCSKLFLKRICKKGNMERWEPTFIF